MRVAKTSGFLDQYDFQLMFQKINVPVIKLIIAHKHELVYTRILKIFYNNTTFRRTILFQDIPLGYELYWYGKLCYIVITT